MPCRLGFQYQFERMKPIPCLYPQLYSELYGLLFQLERLFEHLVLFPQHFLASLCHELEEYGVYICHLK